MTAQLTPIPFYRDFDNQGNPLSFGSVYTYLAGTSTLIATYLDSTQTTPNTNPVQLNARGEAQIWLVPGQTYKFAVFDQYGNQIRIVDQINAFALTQTIIGQLLYPQTPAELAAGVIPTDYFYPSLNILRYGADPTGTSDSAPAFASAVLVLGSSANTIFVPSGTFKINSSIILPILGFLVRITGNGLSSIISLGSGTFDAITWVSPGSTSGYNYAQIDHLCINGNSLTGSGNLISTNGLGGIFIDNVLLYNLTTGGSGIFSNGVNGTANGYNHDVWIRNCYCDTTTGFAGINIGPYSSDSFVVGFTMQGRFGCQHAIYAAAGAAHWRIIGSHVYNCSTDVLSITNNADSFWISDCTFDSGSTGLVNLNGVTNCSFDNCSFTYGANSYAEVLLNNSTNNRFTNCTFEATTAGGGTTYAWRETGTSNFNTFNQCLLEGNFVGGTPFQFALGDSVFRTQGVDTQIFGNASITAGSQTVYVGAGGLGNASELLVLQLMPYSGFIYKLRVACTVAPGAGQSYTCTVRQNGSPAAFTATISGASTFSAVFLGILAIAEGDAISVSVVSSAGAAVSQIRVNATASH